MSNTQPTGGWGRSSGFVSTYPTFDGQRQHKFQEQTGSGRPMMVPPQEQGLVYSQGGNRMQPQGQQLMNIPTGNVEAGVAPAHLYTQPQHQLQYQQHQHQQHQQQQQQQQQHQHQQHQQHQHQQHQHSHQQHQHQHQHQQNIPHGYSHLATKPNITSASVQTNASSMTGYLSQSQSHGSSGVMTNTPMGTDITSGPQGQSVEMSRNALASNQDTLKSESIGATRETANATSGAAARGDDIDTTSQEVSTQRKSAPAVFTAQELRWRGTCYEVKCDETFAVYEGYVVDYDPSNANAIVQYENGWKPVTPVPLDYIRQVASVTNYSTWRPKEGSRVEVKAKAEESEPYGWWGATVVMVKDNLYKIRFDGWGENHDQILDLEMIRPYNSAPWFSPSNFERHVEKVPSEMLQYCKVKNTKCKFTDSFKLIRERVKLFHLGLGPRCEDVLVIGTRKQCNMAKQLLRYLWDLEIRSINDEKKLVEDEKQAREEFDRLKKCVKLEFEFDKSLTKHVIGSKRSYVSKAEQIPGVRHVSVTDGYCAIFADTPEAAADARELLELSMDTIDIPIECKRNLIGEGGQNISNLQKNSGVMLISTWDHYCESAGIPFDPNDVPEGKVRMVIFGPKEHVAQAKALIENDVQGTLQKLDMRRREIKADRELRQRSAYSQEKPYESYYQQDNENGKSGDREQFSKSERPGSGGSEDAPFEHRRRRRGGATGGDRGDRGYRGRGGQSRGGGRPRDYKGRRNEDFERSDEYEKNKNENVDANEEKNNNAQSSQYVQQWDGTNDNDEEHNEVNANAEKQYGDYDDNGDYDGQNVGGDFYDDEDYDYNYNEQPYSRDDRDGRQSRQGRKNRKPPPVYVQKGTSRPQSAGDANTEQTS